MTKKMKTLKKSKSKTAEPITSEVIEANIDMAQRNFKNSKTSASEAAAYAYFVWRDTMSPRADTFAADWIKTEIEKRNDEISRHNKVEKDDRERAEKLALGRLKEAAIDKAEQVRLRGLAALDDEAWKLRLKVPIEAREDANAFTEIVKFVFRFDSPADASNTSRYAKVLEWIDAHCATVQGPAEIVSAIKDAGGFDKVIHMQRLVRNGPKAPDTDEKPEAGHLGGNEGGAEAPDKRKVWHSAPPLASFDLQIEGQSNDLILLLGRYTDGKVEVISPVPADAGVLDTIIERLEMPMVSEAGHPATRVASALKTTRKICLCANADSTCHDRGSLGGASAPISAWIRFRIFNRAAKRGNRDFDLSRLGIEESSLRARWRTARRKHHSNKIG
jgi:hypothetical protein